MTKEEIISQNTHTVNGHSWTEWSIAMNQYADHHLDDYKKRLKVTLIKMKSDTPITEVQLACNSQLDEIIEGLEDSVSAGRLKIFLSESGVPMVGEFPEEPVPYGVGDEQYFGARMDEYQKAVEAAKASAVEIVENIRLRKDTIGDHQFGIGSINADPASIQWHRAHEVIDLPPGWTVEYFEDNYPIPELRKRARLVQPKPAGIVASGGISDQEELLNVIDAVHEQQEADDLKRRNAPVIPEGSEKAETLGEQGERLLNEFSGALGDVDKQQIVEQALNTAGYALGLAFRVCGLKTHINGTVLIKDQKFDISFTPADKQAIDDTLKGLVEAFLSEPAAAQPSPHLCPECSGRQTESMSDQDVINKLYNKLAARDKTIEQLQFDVKMLKADLKTQEREFTSMTSRATALKFWQELKNDISARDKTIEELRADNDGQASLLNRFQAEILKRQEVIKKIDGLTVNSHMSEDEFNYVIDLKEAAHKLLES